MEPPPSCRPGPTSSRAKGVPHGSLPVPTLSGVRLAGRGPIGWSQAGPPIIWVLLRANNGRARNYDFVRWERHIETTPHPKTAHTKIPLKTNSARSIFVSMIVLMCWFACLGLLFFQLFPLLVSASRCPCPAGPWNLFDPGACRVDSGSSGT